MEGFKVFTVDFKGGIWWLCCKFNSKKDIKILKTKIFIQI